MSNQAPRFSIKAVSERTGISTHTLRAWERRYGIPQPSRNTDNRYRLYDEQDIADVLWLKHQIESGFTPALAAALRREPRKPSTPAPEGGPRLEELRDALVTALVGADEPGARGVLDEIIALFTPEQVALQIVEPAMHELGARWQRNELDVRQEHLGSNLIRQRIISLILAQPDVPRPGRSLVAACAPEEQHELGLLLFALLARRQGWQVSYLGQRTPLDSLLPLLRENQWVALSVTTPTGLASLLPLLGDEHLPRARLVFGGYLLNQVERLREHLPGAFLGANAQEAIRTLTTREPEPNEWTPAKKFLRAGMSLQSARLKLGWQTIEHFASARPRTKKSRRELDAQALSIPTLFLIDALSCALAFDVPELIDAQGFWLTQAMPPRGVTASLREHYLDSFTLAVKNDLDVDIARQVLLLTERLVLDSMSSPAANED